MPLSALTSLDLPSLLPNRFSTTTLSVRQDAIELEGGGLPKVCDLATWFMELWFRCGLFRSRGDTAEK